MMYNSYLKLLSRLSTARKHKECYVILYSVPSSVPLRYLKQQRTDLENICVQVVKCNVMV